MEQAGLPPILKNPYFEEALRTGEASGNSEASLEK
jgi:hypothetical protein